MKLSLLVKWSLNATDRPIMWIVSSSQEKHAKDFIFIIMHIIYYSNSSIRNTLNINVPFLHLSPCSWGTLHVPDVPILLWYSEKTISNYKQLENNVLFLNMFFFQLYSKMIQKVNSLLYVSKVVYSFGEYISKADFILAKWLHMRIFK